MKLLTSLSFILLWASVFGIQFSFEGYNVWSITPKNEEEIISLRKWEDVQGIDIWNMGRPGKETRIMVAPLTEVPFLDFLNSAGIQYKLLIENVERNFERERQEQKLALDRLSRIPQVEGQYTVDFNHYWTVDEINDYINFLINFHRDICTVDIIGHTIEGSIMRAVKISIHGEVDGSRPIILIDAGVHAREWIAFMTGIKLLHELVEHPDHFMDILTHVDFIIIPMVNPDGYAYTHNTYRMWRKNRRINPNPNCPGVDGNRNYGHMWQLGTNYCSETYSGTSAFSEPETRSVRAVIDEYVSSIKLYISLHSYGDYVLYPWGYDYVNIDNWEQHHEVGDIFADTVYAINGTVYDVGNAAIMLYIGYGFSEDYTASRGVPLSYTIELSGGAGNGFDLPAYRIPGVTHEAFSGIMEMARYVAQHDWDNNNKN